MRVDSYVITNSLIIVFISIKVKQERKQQDNKEEYSI